MGVSLLYYMLYIIIPVLSLYILKPKLFPTKPATKVETDVVQPEPQAEAEIVENKDDELYREPKSEEEYESSINRERDVYNALIDHDRLNMLLTSPLDIGDFNVTKNEVLDRFNAIKSKTACIYAQRAKVWGTPSWDEKLSIEENMQKCIPVLANFVKTIKLTKHLDAIVIEARGSKYGNCVDAVSTTIRRICQAISDNDPCKSDFMSIQPPEYTEWSLTFGDEAFFLTTFAPCYPITHPRHSYGVDSMFVLLQPEVSFYVHKIPIRGTPGTSRWKIREAFKAIGQPYEHNEPRNTPVAWWFVRPLETNYEALMAGHVTQDDEFGEPVEKGYENIPWWDDNGYVIND